MLIKPTLTRAALTQRFPKLGLEFWVPLPLIAGLFWLGSAWFNHQAFGQTDSSPTQLIVTAEQPVTLSLVFGIATIDAEIDPQLRTTEVSIQTSGGSLQELEFEYPLVDYADIEQAIAQELGLPRTTIRSIIRYRIDY